MDLGDLGFGDISTGPGNHSSKGKTERKESGHMCRKFFQRRSQFRAARYSYRGPQSGEPQAGRTQGPWKVCSDVR